MHESSATEDSLARDSRHGGRRVTTEKSQKRDEAKSFPFSVLGGSTTTGRGQTDGWSESS